MPANAQANADVWYPEEPNVLAASTPAQVVAVPEENAENRVVNGTELRGLNYCAKYDGRTEWDANFVFPPILADTVVQMDASMWTDTVYEVRNTDAQTQSFNLLSRADITLQPLGMSQVLLFAERYLQNVVLETDEVITGTLSADKVEPRRTLAVTPSGAPFTVTVNAESRSELRGSTTNLNASYSNYAGAKVCLWYGQIPVRVGDYVWHDLNHNGLQDTGETPLSGVPVHWDGPESGSDVTGPDGIWGSPLMAAGPYTITFSTVDGYTSTVSLNGDIRMDSNPIVSTVTLNPGDVNLTIDHGFVGNGQLGDRCWRDRNNDGLQDSGEPGVRGCVITIYTDGGTHVATTTSDSQGAWSVSNLPPGVYCPRSELPEPGYRYTQALAGDPTLDSNADPASGMMECVTLSPQVGMTNITLDVGVVQDHDIGISKKEMTPINVKAGEVVTNTVTIFNSGHGTAYNAYVVDSPLEGLEFVTYPDFCQVTEVKELLCQLGDVAPRQEVVLVYTMKVVRSTPGALLNHVMVHARGVDTDENNNDYTAYVFIFPDGQSYWIFLPIIGHPETPGQVNPCQETLDAELHVESKGKVYDYVIKNYRGVTLTLPDGQDLDFKTPTKLWLTPAEGADFAGTHIVWIQYKPFYVVVQGLGADTFIFAGGYPGESFRAVTRLTSWLGSETEQCHNGATFETDIDPPLEIVFVFAQALLEAINETINK